MNHKTYGLKGEGIRTCPSCNGVAILVERTGDAWVVACDNCRLSTPEYPCPEAAIELWNTRVGDDDEKD